MTKYTIYTTEEYEEWFDDESPKSRLQIQGRLSRVKNEGHFGHIRNLKDGLCELKFNDGRRIYYSILPEQNVILLLGGNKNGQEKDIKKARKILKNP